jgi:guanylate kinase
MSGRLFVVAAPSGAGKTSLVKALLEREPQLALSISHTTRAPRPTEQDGREYHFVDKATFEAMKDAGQFLEWAPVFDNFYGTGRAQVEALRNSGHDVIREIDWPGAQQVRKAAPDCKSIFILPPSRIELESRRRNRKTDSEEVIQRRLRDSITDMSHYAEFDRVIVNDQFETAVNELLGLVRGGAGFEASRPELAPLIKDLLG